MNIKAIFENGDSITTAINGTVQDVVKYYVGNIFNIGSDTDNLQKCVKVEFLSGTEYEWNNCTFFTDYVWLVPDDEIKKYDLFYPLRVHSHVVNAPDNYIGVREISAAYTM